MRPEQIPAGRYSSEGLPKKLLALRPRKASGFVLLVVLVASLMIPTTGTAATVEEQASRFPLDFSFKLGHGANTVSNDQASSGTLAPPTSTTATTTTTTTTSQPQPRTHPGPITTIAPTTTRVITPTTTQTTTTRSSRTSTQSTTSGTITSSTLKTVSTSGTTTVTSSSTITSGTTTITSSSTSTPSTTTTVTTPTTTTSTTTTTSGATTYTTTESSTVTTTTQTTNGPSYIIFVDPVDPGMIKAKNGITGKIDFSGTDAAAVIQKALDALKNGGKVLIADGTYSISSAIEIRNENIAVSGNGAGTVLRMNNGANLDSLLWIVAHFTTVSDITVDSNQAGQSSGAGYGIAVVDRNDCTIRNARLVNGRKGGLCLQGAKRCKVLDSLIQNVGSTSVMANGIYIYGDSWTSSDDNLVSGCLINTVSKWGIQIQGSDATHLAQRNTISDTTMVNCGTPIWSGGGVNLYAGASDNKVDTCTVCDCTAFGVEIYPSRDAPPPVRNSVLNTVVINQRRGNGDTGTAFQIDTGASDNVISGCIAYNVDLDGFAVVSGSTRNKIDGCCAVNATRNGYLIWNQASYNVISNSYGQDCRNAGINISPGDCYSNVITSNDMQNCWPISDSGTNTSVDFNPPNKAYTRSEVDTWIQDALSRTNSRIIAFSSFTQLPP